MFVYVFILMVIISFIYSINDDRIITSINKKHDIDIILCLFIHNIISVFLTLGWLSNNKNILMIHIISILFIMMHWKINNSLCVLTVYTNKRCGLKDDEKYIHIFNRDIDDKESIEIKYLKMIALLIISITKLSLLQ